MRQLPVVFNVSLSLFLVSAISGALISYNPALAWSRLFLIALSVVVCVLFAALPDRAGFSWLPVALPVALIVYFALTNDWTARLGKVAWLDPALRWFAVWQPRVPGLALDSNSFGGVLAMLLPLQIAALAHARILGRPASVALVVVSILGLVVSASRGAWIASGLVAWFVAVWYLLARVMPGWQSGRTRIVVWIALVAYFVLTVGGALTFTPLGAWLLETGGGHWVVARHSFDLASDYPFTGIGLGAFTMAYSSYVLLVHVPHTIHAHNLFLDIWLEQGLLGLLAFVGLIVAGVANGSHSRWRVAALAALAVMLTHGLLDDPFFGYGGNAIPFLLMPFGLLARESVVRTTRAKRWVAPIVVGVVVLGGVLIAGLPTTRAMIEANLGALAQTRAELSVYEWPRYSFQDQLRREGIVQLDPAIAYYQRALELDPANVTAHRRLGQIELSLGQYDAARRDFEMAFARAPNQLATRVLLGELLALAGQPDQAVSLWRGLELEANPLQTRLWWYEFIGDTVRLQKLLLVTGKEKF